MAYFTIMAELRGCYSDNESAYTIRADTRRELKTALESTASGIGLNKKAIASHAAEAWRKRKSIGVYPLVLPFRHEHHAAGSRPMGLFVYNATRAEYLAAQEES